jgi:hypothetical protein
LEITTCDIQFNQYGFKKRPYAFTEPGVDMLSSVLNSKTAIHINMEIMLAFVIIKLEEVHITSLPLFGIDMFEELQS